MTQRRRLAYVIEVLNRVPEYTLATLLRRAEEN